MPPQTFSMGPLFARSGTLFALLLSGFAVSACNSSYYQSLLLDGRVLLPSGRVGKMLSWEDSALAPSDVQTGLTVEGGILGGGGSSSKMLSSKALVGGQTFDAPQAINTNFDFKVVDLSLRWRQALIRRRVGYDLSLGPGWTDFNVLASSATQQGRRDASSPVLRLGAGGFVRVFSNTSVEVEGTILKAKRDFSSVGGRRLSIAQKLGEHVTVKGGYAYWDVETIGGGQSRIEVHLQGPAVGLDVKF